MVELAPGTRVRVTNPGESRVKLGGWPAIPIPESLLPPGIGGGGEGTVQAVNDIEPDEDGNITLTASDVGAVDAEGVTAAALDVAIVQLGVIPRIRWTGSAWPSRVSVVPDGYTGPVIFDSATGASSDPDADIPPFDTFGDTWKVHPDSPHTPWYVAP